MSYCLYGDAALTEIEINNTTCYANWDTFTDGHCKLVIASPESYQKQKEATERCGQYNHLCCLANLLTHPVVEQNDVCYVNPQDDKRQESVSSLVEAMLGPDYQGNIKQEIDKVVQLVDVLFKDKQVESLTLVCR